MAEEISKNWCHTQVKVVECHYTWTINNFSLLPQENGKYLKSSSFSDKTKDQSKWCISLYPKGFYENDQNHLSLFLYLISSNKCEVKTKFKFTMSNAKTKKIKGKWLTRTFSKGTEWGFNKFIARDLLLNETKNLLPDDTLTIRCDLILVSQIVNSCGQNMKFKVPKHTLAEDYGLLLKNGTFSDVTLSVQGENFQAHKTVLAARSPVFRAMFEHQMRERELAVVTITDINLETIRELLEYMYTGKTAKLEEMAYDLLIAADKYALERLKVMCENMLCSNLSIDNASRIFILADLHNAKELKAQTIDFINRNTLQVMETSEWKSMIQTHPYLIDEAYRASKASV